MQPLILNGFGRWGVHTLREGVVSVGRHPSNHISVPDPSVSGNHCELRIQNDKVRVRDLGSTNGTFINDVHVQEAELLEGQILRLGEPEFRLERAPDPSSVEIRIPQVAAPALPPVQIQFEDGTLACLNHPDVPAVARCSRCGHAWCAQCVHVVGIEGRSHHCYCPHCSIDCEILVTRTPRGAKAKLDQLVTRTVRMFRRR